MSSFKKPANQGPSLREFNIEDPTTSSGHHAVMNQSGGWEPPNVSETPEQYPVHPQHRQLSDAERMEYIEMRRKQASQPERLPSHAKTRLELLTGIGRLTRNVEVDGIKFTLRSLKAREAREATMSIFGAKTDIEASFEIRRHTLARAITAIDDQSIEFVVGGDSIDLKLDLIDSMEDAIVVRLYTEFNKLREEIQSKYGVSDDKEAEAAAAALGK